MLDKADDSVVKHLLNIAAYNQNAAEIHMRGLARAHDEYVKKWQQRMRDALRQSPVYR